VVDGFGQGAVSRAGKEGNLAEGEVTKQRGIFKLREFDQTLGHTRIHHSLSVQHSGYGPEGDNQPNLT